MVGKTIRVSWPKETKCTSLYLSVVTHDEQRKQIVNTHVRAVYKRLKFLYGV